MSSPSVQQNLYQQKINGIVNDLNSLKLQLSETERKVYSIDESISKLPARISSIRQMNYQIQKSLEGDQLRAAETWARISPAVKSEVSSRSATLKSEISSIERDVNAHRLSTSYNLIGLSGLDVRMGTIRTLVYDLGTRINGEMTQLESVLTPLEQGIATAEEVVKLTSAASFQWKTGETPVVASHAKDMNEKTEGILTLTNQRIIYESEKEVVLKKTFFIATEKKKERTTILERPIGSVSQIVRGRVGLLAGAGLFIDFKQGDPQLKLDTKSEEADRIIRFHSLIASGQIDEELSKNKPTEGKAAEKIVIACPKCGAPYTEEIYRGQLAVQCKYCGTTISVK
jgi:hypothetical protein